MLVWALHALLSAASPSTIILNTNTLVHTTSVSGKSSCASGLVSVTFNATVSDFSLGNLTNQFQVTEILQELFEVNSTLVSRSTTGLSTVTGPYDISAILCVPKHTNQSVNTVQILAHGLGLDKTYWDIAPDYSYVEAAAEAGYATFAYDRLGVGGSSHPDPVNVVQSTVHVEVAHALVQHLKTGIFGFPSFDNVVCAAHSFGSTIQIGHNGKYPSDCRATILTGIGSNFDYLATTLLMMDPTIASTVNESFAGLDTGYLIAPSAVSFQQPFFRYPFFDTAVFERQFANAGTLALGDDLTAVAVLTPATNYTGPVDVVLGQYDYVFCMGDCNTEDNPAASLIPAFYPAVNTNRSSSFIVPNSGHCINDHYTAGEAFEHMLGFVQANGL